MRVATFHAPKARIVRGWISTIEMGMTATVPNSMSGTKVMQIYKTTGNLKTGNVRLVQLLLGHTQMHSTVSHSTVSHLGGALEDALASAAAIEI